MAFCAVVRDDRNVGGGADLAYLVAASLLWAFSFGLIKGHLVAYDALAVAFVRLAISLVVFLPWLWRHPLPRPLILRALGLGAVQFGLMYGFYISAYRFLPAYGVAFFTIFTPLYVTWFHDLLARRWRPRHTVAALLAVSGAGLVLAGGFTAGAASGIVLLQAANLCFAVGQVGYRRLLRVSPPTPATMETGLEDDAGAIRWPETALLAWMYLGATLVTGLAVVVLADHTRLGFTGQAWLVLLYLGIVPTGAGFYLWNKGAARARAGILAACNNLKIPLAVICAWLIFGEEADYLRVLVGLVAVVAALFLAGDSSGTVRPESRRQAGARGATRSSRPAPRPGRRNGRRSAG